MPSPEALPERCRSATLSAVLTTTYLGHQGWLFATCNSCILVDPLLVEPFGHGGSVGVIYPPRILDLGRMPPIDGVFLTHEHEDHFNVPSINRISREVPIYVPRRSSSALHHFLANLGFDVRLLSGGDSVDIGDLRFATFSPDHVRRDELDEWDTSPFCVIDLADGGSFFSTVDVSPPDSMQAQLEELSGRSLWSITNNTIDMSILECPAGAAPDPIALASRIFADHARRFTPSRPPLATLFCGTGFCFRGDRSFLNKHFFPLDSAALASALNLLRPTERFIVPVPGTEIATIGSTIHNVATNSAFLRTARPADWPDRTYSPTGGGQYYLEDLHPATARTELKEGELALLTESLSSFAEYLYATPLFRALYSLGDGSLEKDIRPTLGIRAIDGADSRFFEYDPSACGFHLLQGDARLDEYVVGLECFASDLLALLSSNLSPAALMFGRVRRWRCRSHDLIGALDRAVWEYAHPLRHPERYLELYEAIFAREPSCVPRVAARSATANSR
jgi:Beta-lactamase superfamily domain